MINEIAILLFKRTLNSLNNTLESLKSKVTKNGKPYSTTWVEELSSLALLVGEKGFLILLENLINKMRNTSENSPMTIHQVIGYLIPKEIRYLPTVRLEDRIGQWCGVVLDVLTTSKIIIETNKKVISIGNPYSMPMDTYYLNTHLTGMGIELPIIKSVLDKPKATYKTLGSIWCKDGKELDHCSSTINLLNSTPLTFKKEVLDMMENKFHLSEAKKEKWNKAFSTFEEYVKAREDAFNSYVSKLPEYINNIAKEGKCVFNTYAPDSRGRLYPITDVGNYVGIKQVRASVAFSDGCYVNSQEDDL